MSVSKVKPGILPPIKDLLFLKGLLFCLALSAAWVSVLNARTFGNLTSHYLPCYYWKGFIKSTWVEEPFLVFSTEPESQCAPMATKTWGPCILEVTAKPFIVIKSHLVLLHQSERFTYDSYCWLVHRLAGAALSGCLLSTGSCCQYSLKGSKCQWQLAHRLEMGAPRQAIRKHPRAISYTVLLGRKWVEILSGAFSTTSLRPLKNIWNACIFSSLNSPKSFAWAKQKPVFMSHKAIQLHYIGRSWVT